MATTDRINQAIFSQRLILGAMITGIGVFTIVALAIGPMDRELEVINILGLVWIVLGFWTAFEVLDAGQFGSLFLVGGAGVAGFLYADRLGSVALMRILPVGAGGRAAAVRATVRRRPR